MKCFEMPNASNTSRQAQFERKKMHSKNQIRKAGKIFKSKTNPTKEEIDFALDILTDWRSAHGKVIERFQDCLISKAIEIDLQ